MEGQQATSESINHAAQSKSGHGVAVRLVTLVAIGAVVGLVIYSTPRLFFGSSQPEERPQLKTGGTSAIFVVAENLWKRKYADAKKVDIVCDSAGTTVGVTRMLDKTYAIAFTHDPVSAELREKAKKGGCDVVQIPLLLCGVVPAYRLDGLKGKAPLKFTGPVLAEIFLGKITTWNDPALQNINPGVSLPAKKITVVHREDSSGTTQLFSEYLAAVSPAWSEKVGPPAAEMKWPVGVAAARNQGVAGAIDRTDGAIGYIDRLYTSFQDIQLAYGAVENKSHAFVRADPPNLTAAAEAALGEIPESLTFSLIDRPGKTRIRSQA